MRAALLISCLAGLFLAACGGPGHFDGTVAGQSLKVKESIFFTQPFTVPGQAQALGTAVAVFMSDQSDLCAHLNAQEAVPNATGLVIGLAVTQGGLSVSSALTTGSYRLVGPLDFFSTPPVGTRLTYPVFEKLDGACATTLSQEGLPSSGTVTLDSFTAGKDASGSFDLTFGGGSGEGSFSAKFCDYVPPETQGATTCQ